jgi:hypothetical protein
MKDGAGLFRIRTLQTYAMGLNEKLIVTSVFFMVTMAFGLLMFVRVYMHHSDSAMFIELVENTARYGLPLTQINASINDAVWTWFATYLHLLMPISATRSISFAATPISSPIRCQS